MRNMRKTGSHTRSELAVLLPEVQGRALGLGMLSESAAAGDQLQALRDLRDLLARQIESCDSLRDLASLSGRLQAVMDQVAELEPKKAEGDGIDEIANRRATRRTTPAKSSGRAKRTS